jgi:hypothetical protein
LPAVGFPTSVKRENHTSRRRAQASQRVHSNLGARHGQAHQHGGLLIAADRVNVAAKAREVSDDNCDHEAG